MYVCVWISCERECVIEFAAMAAMRISNTEQRLVGACICVQMYVCDMCVCWMFLVWQIYAHGFINEKSIERSHSSMNELWASFNVFKMYAFNAVSYHLPYDFRFTFAILVLFFVFFSFFWLIIFIKIKKKSKNFERFQFLTASNDSNFEWEWKTISFDYEMY